MSILDIKDFPSVTAAIHFKMRGLHPDIDSGAVIFDDPVAGKLHSCISTDINFSSSFWKSIRTNMLFRSRVAEHYLLESVKKGVSQYVILGAGLDTFAARNLSWASNLKTFNVDFDKVITARNAIIGSHGIDVSCDISELTIDHLVKKGFDPSMPTLFSMLGVSMYLNHAEQNRVYAEIASIKSVELVMTHMTTDSTANIEKVIDSVAALGEPIIGKISDKDLEKMLKRSGFNNISKPSNSLLKEWYHNSSLSLPNLKTLTIAKN